MDFGGGRICAPWEPTQRYEISYVICTEEVNQIHSPPIIASLFHQTNWKVLHH